MWYIENSRRLAALSPHPLSYLLVVRVRGTRHHRYKTSSFFLLTVRVYKILGPQSTEEWQGSVQAEVYGPADDERQVVR